MFEDQDLVAAMAELESQLNEMVVSSTKTAQRATQAPAVITVIKADEIQARGYTSLADVLRSVPGFYDIYDFTTHNVGIRGVNGGVRASGNVVKLMIDGQPVSFRTSTGNFFGEELVPLSAVERVEVIRGPASALYGANAFLGVINVITRSGKSVEGARAVAQVGAVRDRPGYGGGLLLGATAENAEVVAAVHGMRLDRSGLTLPDSSPLLDDSRAGLAERGASQSDLSRPKTLFARASVGTLASGRATALASIQNLDAGGEFQDFAPLTHGTRIALVNQNYRLSYELQPRENLELRISGSYFDSRPSSRERLNVGQDNSLLLRNLGVSGFDASAEARVQLIETLALTVGTDYVAEDHTLQTYDVLLTRDVVTESGSVLRPAGTITPGQDAGRSKTLTNIGAFLQAVYQPTVAFGITAGARVDVHNVYSTHVSPRLGLVYAPEDRPWHLKLLFGSSFKAPSAEQLYTIPMKAFDIRGNEELIAQTARTGELAGGYRLGDVGEVSANLFVTQVTGHVEFVQRGIYLEAENALDEVFVGGEVDARFRLAHALQLRTGIGVAKSVVKTRDEQAVVIGGSEVEQPFFPPYQVHLIADYTLPLLGLRLSPEVSYIGARMASQSNALRNGEAYELPAYLYTAVALSLPEQKLFGDRPTAVSLRVSNLLDTRYAEPGYGGIDIPAQGRTVFLTLSQGI